LESLPEKKIHNLDWQNLVWLAVIGSAAGFLGGILGLGGAIIIVPSLVMILGFSQHMAQGTALMMMVLPVGSLAAYQYYQKGMVDLRASLILAIFFFVSGYFGSKLAITIPQEILKKVFALLLLIIAIKIWFQK
jgi:uncharacterized protein